MDNVRKGKGFCWSDKISCRDGQSRTTGGFTVDNLDTKKIADAGNNYEKLFILVRELLEESDTKHSEGRLQCCQNIADAIKDRGLLR